MLDFKTKPPIAGAGGRSKPPVVGPPATLGSGKENWAVLTTGPVETLGCMGSREAADSNSSKAIKTLAYVRTTSRAGSSLLLQRAILCSRSFPHAITLTSGIGERSAIAGCKRDKSMSDVIATMVWYCNKRSADAPAAVELAIAQTARNIHSKGRMEGRSTDDARPRGKRLRTHAHRLKALWLPDGTSPLARKLQASSPPASALCI